MLTSEPDVCELFLATMRHGVRDALGHLAGLLCIKFREDILIIYVAGPVLLEFAELADSPIYPPSSILVRKKNTARNGYTRTGIG
jgi:hypothetical protein